MSDKLYTVEEFLTMTANIENYQECINGHVFDIESFSLKQHKIRSGICTTIRKYIVHHSSESGMLSFCGVIFNQTTLALPAVWDVYVLLEKALFQLYIYTPERLVQDFQAELEYYDYYRVDSNLVLVTSADKETIISTILHLYADDYFKEIKPLENMPTNLLIKIYPKGDALL